VNPSPPAAPATSSGRVVAEQLAESVGQAFVVDNRPGAGGSVGGSAVVSRRTTATRDGVDSTRSRSARFALEKQPYDPIADLTHIASIARHPASSWPTRPLASTHHRPRERGERTGTMQFGSAGRRRSATSTAS
jgi:hypothetical protein